MSAEKRWKEIAAGPEADIDLVESALLIAAHEYPELDVAAYQARMDRIAATLKARLRRDIGPVESIVALNRYLFEELGFRGNAREYYDPRNSFLNEVLDRKLGIPITLAIVYIEVGRHIGLALHGVSFPGHFLVKCPARDGVIVLDPYAGGASLSLEHLQQRLRALRGGAAPPADLAQRMLAAAGKKDILARMLRNLKGIYLQRRDFSRALAAADRVITLEPGAADEYRDRASIYMELECFRAALSDFRNYLMLKPGADDAAAVQRRVVELQQIAARLN
ncbi:MAG TPA: tetratricopeptide repeat protein [Burkholderiales bacterium]|nr:tetratricopeptide repeat protein [Burkholderiales bacterium]